VHSLLVNSVGFRRAGEKLDLYLQWMNIKAMK